MTYDSLKTVTLKLLAYCRANNWAGYDPYDALNSPVIKYLPFLNLRLPRIALTQVLKKNPINLRPLLLIPKTENPKAIALFLMAFLKLRRLGLLEDESLIPLMVEKLISLRAPNNLSNPSNPNNPYWCWGYSFPWQTRTILVPCAAPNIVCTCFVANALLDAYERNPEPRYLSMATSAAEYILNELYWTEGNSTACFSYFRYPVESLPHQVHNINFLGAALLCRVYKHTAEKKFIEPALKAAQYSAAKQHDDGSWNYGEHPTHRWIDSFHTGYKLCSLRSICQYTGRPEFEVQIRGGFKFYRHHFFEEDGAPRYFHDRTYPIDIHNVAQSIITLLTFKGLNENNVSLAHAVFTWAMTHMWNEHGYFYYQINPLFTTKTSYMRWSQAWMFLALSTLLEHCE